jgi:hypothetical protein
MNMMSKGLKMTGVYFTQEIIAPLAVECYGKGREKCQRRFTVHFENAPMHRTITVVETLRDYELIWMEHPPSSPDLAPYDFFLFTDIKD